MRAVGTRVLPVDDQPIVRTGLRTVLTATGGFDGRASWPTASTTPWSSA